MTVLAITNCHWNTSTH